MQQYILSLTADAIIFLLVNLIIVVLVLSSLTQQGWEYITRNRRAISKVVKRGDKSQKTIRAAFIIVYVSVLLAIDLRLSEDDIPGPRLLWVCFHSFAFFYLFFFSGKFQNCIIGWSSKIEQFEARS